MRTNSDNNTNVSSNNNNNNNMCWVDGGVYVVHMTNILIVG